MKYTTIKSGYRVSVDTWENDMDGYTTETLEGLSEDEVKFVYELCLLHRSGYTSPGMFGNMYEPETFEIREYEASLCRVRGKYGDCLRHKWESFDGVEDLTYKLSLRGSEFYTRVFEKIKVEYIPEDIVLQDVTEMFTEEN